ncbi:hypothetical protein HPB50_019649 [Hyalomma asiaticum]|uniref:Uncharacterized protein n=1 Tax=Hyalomma asiaticum TaxID=266040 RepID=A0ACB7SIY4_HYAAI|nr:hypothetical protein HPB50_019649 [Hyalomma asiaticum]
MGDAPPRRSDAVVRKLEEAARSALSRALRHCARYAAAGYFLVVSRPLFFADAAALETASLAERQTATTQAGSAALGPLPRVRGLVPTGCAVCVPVVALSARRRTTVFLHDRRLSHASLPR